MRWIGIASLVAATACDGSHPPSATENAAPPAAPAIEPLPATPYTLDRGDGLVVDVERAGSGAEATSASTVTLHYRAFVAGAEKPFDSSYDSGIPLELALAGDAMPRAIDGLTRGLAGLRTGTRAKITIPAALAYGGEGNESAGVPKDANLIYEVELVGVR